MGDLKAGEGFIDAVYITNYDHVAVTGLSPTSFVLKLSDGTKTVLTVAESGYGVYKVTDFAPLADTEYFTIWAVDGPYTIYARAKLFKVGGGRTEDIHDIVKASGTGDLAAVLADTNELQTDWVDGGRLDLLLDAVALEATLAVVDGLIDGIVADIGVFPTANYATLAAYVEGVRTRLIAIVADTGELQTDWVNGGRLDLLIDSIISKVDVVDGLHDKATTDYTGNTFIKDVLGSKDDTAAVSILLTNSLMRYMKGALGATWTSESLKAIYDLIDAVLDLTETGGTLTATGAENSIYLANAPSGVWEPRVVFIDLTNMQAGDSVRIRETYRIKSGGALLHLDGKTYTGVQPADNKAIQVVLKPNRYGVEVTLEQTAGTNRTYDWEVLYSG